MEEQKMLTWLEKSKENDEKETLRLKKEFISEIKKLKVEEIIQKKEKLTLWQRIKKVLNF
jgi:hypothetical protein